MGAIGVRALAPMFLHPLNMAAGTLERPILRFFRQREMDFCS